MDLDRIYTLTGAAKVEVIEHIQSLWSGYGEIVRVRIDGRPMVVKSVSAPSVSKHPRDWNTGRSHERKLKSYSVEHTWYRDWSVRCSPSCRVASPFATEQLGDATWLFVLEDLDASGFARRNSRLDEDGVALCLGWLADFHATFLGDTPTDLWEVGTYWHLDTRPDELRAMPDGPLKRLAPAINQALNSAVYQTIVHGDAKVANFCFTDDIGDVASVDFQYVGGGCGIKDVVYFLGSCLTESECEQKESEWLDIYFSALGERLHKHRPGTELGPIEDEWRRLYPFAWTDFYRFLAGWSPGHAKINRYSKKLADQVVATLS